MGLPDEPMEFSPEMIVETLIFNCGQIVGSQQNGKEYLYEALDYAAKGRVRAITEIYSLDEIGYAYERVKSGRVRFRAVIAT
jgi:D-arabinose 1-dehydrogenase-like Zn-dependent alcohol dehydrogenase